MTSDRFVTRKWLCVASGVLSVLVTAPTIALAQGPGPVKPPTAPIAPAPQGGVAQCATAQASVPRFIGVEQAMISPDGRSAAEASVAEAVKRGKSEADGFDAVAGGAFLAGRMHLASWSTLEAASRAWNARRAANAGVALIYVGRADDARPFIACARSLDPASVFALEAEAMLAYWRKDCATAFSLFDQLVAAAPRDMNVHYSAGAVHYGCGDRARAVTELKAAAEIAPTDRVVTASFNAVAAGAPSAPSPMPPAVRRQVNELLRFMDDAIAIADRSRTEQLQIAKIINPDSPGDAMAVDIPVKLLHQRVADQRRMLTLLEQQTAAMPASFGAGRWTGILDLCARTYFEITGILYDAATALDHVRKTAVMAGALGLTPGGLAERMRGKVSGDFVIQDALQNYLEATRPVNGVAVSCDVKVPAYEAMVQSVETNLNMLKDGFPKSAAREATTWLRYAHEAADYGQRTSRLMEFPSASVRDMRLANLKQSYSTGVQRRVVARTATMLRSYQQEVQRMAVDDPRTILGQRPIACYAKPLKPVTFADALEALFNALQAAGEYDAKFESPDCDITFAGVKVSCKPLAFEGVKAEWDGPVKISASATDTRWGVDASAGPLSGGSGGSRVDVAESKIKDSAYGVEASASVSTWIERDASGEVNVFAEAKTSLGVGVDAEGLGSVSCDFFEASAKVNLRAFAAALVQ